MYDDIINLPHHESKRGHMSLYNRAAQFAPFAALNGYYDSIVEVSRVTFDKKVLTDEERLILNSKLNVIKAFDEVSVTYFVKDKFKDGGEYVTKKGCVRKVDSYHKFILMDDLSKINFFDILDIDM